VRELSLAANKVVAASVRCDELANSLKLGYRTLFTFAGQGPGSSRRELFISEVEKIQSEIGPMQAEARTVLESGVAKLADDAANDVLLKLDANLTHLDRVREKLQHDLASVETQNKFHREQVLTRIVDRSSGVRRE
jgi:hypothetical protein